MLRQTTRALLAYLAATVRPHSRHALTDLFCQGVDEPPGALRSILSRLRQKLGPQTLLAEGESIQINSAATWVDCRDFASLLAADRSTYSGETLARAVDYIGVNFW